jgi:hypothetical protein
MSHQKLTESAIERERELERRELEQLVRLENAWQSAGEPARASFLVSSGLWRAVMHAPDAGQEGRQEAARALDG